MTCVLIVGTVVCASQEGEGVVQPQQTPPVSLTPQQLQMLHYLQQNQVSNHERVSGSSHVGMYLMHNPTGSWVVVDIFRLYTAPIIATVSVCGDIGVRALVL